MTVTAADLATANDLSLRLGAPMARVVRLTVDAEGERFLSEAGFYRGDTARQRITLK